MAYDLLLLVHLASACILFGGRLVSLLLCLQLRVTPEAQPVLALVHRLETRRFGLCFAVQPLSGLALVHLTGFSLSDSWIGISIGLYGLALCLWLVELALLNDAGQAMRDGSADIAASRQRAAGAVSALVLATLAAAIAVMTLKP